MLETLSSAFRILGRPAQVNMRDFSKEAHTNMRLHTCVQCPSSKAKFLIIKCYDVDSIPVPQGRLAIFESTISFRVFGTELSARMIATSQATIT